MPRENLCDTCTYRKEIRTDRGNLFIMCRRGLEDPAYPKYPRLPVLQCRGYENTQNGKNLSGR